MEGVTVHQFDAVVEESYFEKKVAANLHESFAIRQRTTLPRSEVVFYEQMFVILLLGYFFTNSKTMKYNNARWGLHGR